MSNGASTEVMLQVERRDVSISTKPYLGKITGDWHFPEVLLSFLLSSLLLIIDSKQFSFSYLVEQNLSFSEIYS